MKYEKAVDCLSRRISGFSEKLGPGVAMWEVDENWLPALRNMCLNSELQGKTVTLAVPPEINCRWPSVASECRCWQWCRSTS